MDLRRLRPAEWFLAAAAIMLFVSLFLPWYGLAEGSYSDAHGGAAAYGPAVGLTGWEAFSAVEVVLSACTLVALVAVALQATQHSPALPIVSATAATWAGIATTVLVVVK